jgi:serine/threonine protein kinase
MPTAATLDGGDVLRTGDTLHVGLSSRTDAAGVAALAAFAAPHGLTVRAVPLAAGLHLKSVVTLADPRTLVLQAGAVDPAAFPGLDVIEVPEPVGANVLALGRRVLVSTAAPITAARLPRAASTSSASTSRSSTRETAPSPACRCGSPRPRTGARDAADLIPSPRMTDDSGQGPDDTVASARAGGPSPARLGHGDVVGERWRLDEFLKGGGMGRVWRATDLRLGEPVALKLMDPAIVETDAARARFMREAQAAARVRGANVVQVLDFDVDAATRVPYLAMELLHGEDLAERLTRGPLPFDETVAVLAGICGAIARAHRLQVIHRDLKPGNIFLTDGDDGPETKVLDFGIVKLDGVDTRHPLTNVGATLGTVSYMSPEQIADAQRVDHRTDLWSIAVIAYECLTGRRPFRGDSLLELIHEICYSAPVAPSRLASVPPASTRGSPARPSGTATTASPAPATCSTRSSSSASPPPPAPVAAPTRRSTPRTAGRPTPTRSTSACSRTSPSKMPSCATSSTARTSTSCPAARASARPSS